MTNDRDLDQKVRDWLDEQPPGPPDRNAVYARVMDRLPATHQRRHWWPFQWNPFAAGATRSADANGPHPQGRSRTMLNAVRIVAAAVIIAIGGALAFVTDPLGPAQEPVVPGAALGPEDVVYVTGTATYLEDTKGCTITSTDTYIEKRDCGVEYEYAMDDPRLSGLGAAVIERIDPIGVGLTGTIAGTTEMEHEDGAWVGTYQGAELLGSAPLRLFSVQTGTGAYEGLSVVLFYETVNDGTTFDLEGMILPTEMLVYPE